MAGSNSGFDADVFRTAIRAAMTMGSPVTPSEQATFVWDIVRTFDEDDAAGNPWNWSATPSTSTSFDDVQVPVAVEFRGGPEINTTIGEFDVSSALLTVLDEDFAQITVDGVMANKVLLGGNVYTIEYIAPPLGLFDVTVFQIHVKAVDES